MEPTSNVIQRKKNDMPIETEMAFLLKIALWPATSTYNFCMSSVAGRGQSRTPCCSTKHVSPHFPFQMGNTIWQMPDFLYVIIY